MNKKSKGFLDLEMVIPRSTDKSLISSDDAREVRLFFDTKLINFVNKIERRFGWASMEDIYIELIDLYNYFGVYKVIDTLPTKIQIEMMWRFLKEKKIKLDQKIKK